MASKPPFYDEKIEWLLSGESRAILLHQGQWIFKFYSDENFPRSLSPGTRKIGKQRQYITPELIMHQTHCIDAIFKSGDPSFSITCVVNFFY